MKNEMCVMTQIALSSCISLLASLLCALLLAGYSLLLATLLGMAFWPAFCFFDENEKPPAAPTARAGTR
jgi:hypothetical protein